MTFQDLGLCSPILKALESQGYNEPTPIQAQAIPPILAGRDIMAAAQTGTGKTAGFTLPILHQLREREPARANHTRVLILTPTRELAAQVQESVRVYSQHLPIRSAVVFGGVKINPQMMTLRKGVEILVATPGRLLDLHQQNAIKFSDIETLVLDEADRMLDMGFIHDIKRIFKLLPKKRQNLLFSATFSDPIRALAKELVNDPVEVSVTPPNTTVERIEQKVYPVTKSQKSKLLVTLLRERQLPQVLVFTRTKHGANRLTRQLENDGILAAAIHGNKSQGARTKALADFKANKIQVLVATDIAARGLDIDQLPLVVNYELPQVAEDYVHRIGRTGRAGATGHALSLVTEDELRQLRAIEKFTNQTVDMADMTPYKSDFTAVTLTGPGKKPPAKAAQTRRRAKPANKDGSTSASRSHQNRSNKPRAAQSRGNKSSANKGS